mgnify:CR=1 FL=1
MFTNSKFFYDFQAERKTFDIVQCPWKHSDKSDDKFREVSYTLNLNQSIGPKTSRATEVQTMRSNSVPGHIYNVDVETTNADIPYAATFFVSTHYCLVKVSESESFLLSQANSAQFTNHLRCQAPSLMCRKTEIQPENKTQNVGTANMYVRVRGQKA